MKPVVFLGSSLNDLRAFPEAVRRDAGFQIHALQCGLLPANWKPMSGIGPGAIEIRIRINDQWRVLCVAKHKAAVYVLHAFKKTSRKTPKRDLELARKRFALIGEAE